MAKNLYAGIDERAIQQDAEACLLPYGATWHPQIITAAQGSYIYTATGHKMLDWTSGQMSCLIGHGNAEIADTMAAHAAALDHLFSAFLSPPVVRLGKRLSGLCPAPLRKCLFLSTGGESNEAAIRLAKFVTGKWEVVGLSASWHGMGGASMGAQYHSGRSGYGPVVSVGIFSPF